VSGVCGGKMAVPAACIRVERHSRGRPQRSGGLAWADGEGGRKAGGAECRARGGEGGRDRRRHIDFALDSPEMGLPGQNRVIRDKCKILVQFSANAFSSNSRGGEYSCLKLARNLSLNLVLAFLRITPAPKRIWPCMHHNSEPGPFKFI
jgi:hypothetical protein